MEATDNGEGKTFNPGRWRRRRQGLTGQATDPVRNVHKRETDIFEAIGDDRPWSVVWAQAAFSTQMARRDTRGMTPLHRAVLATRPDVVRWLLNRGADPGARDAEGRTPLHLAARLPFASMTDGMGKAVSPSDDWERRRSALRGSTALDQIVEALLNKKADPDAREGRTGAGKTPSEVAGDPFHPVCVRCAKRLRVRKPPRFIEAKSAQAKGG